MERPNWFLALPLPLDAGWEHCGSALPPGLRRFDPADLHLTLAFLGPCGEPAALSAWRALAPLRHPAVTVTAGAWLAMGPPRRPSAYALGLAAGRDAVAELIERWGPLALAAAGRPGARRPALPHVSLARPPRRGGEAQRQAMAAWLPGAPSPAGAVRLEHLALYTWSADRRRRLFRIAAQRRLDSPECASVAPEEP